MFRAASLRWYRLHALHRPASAVSRMARPEKTHAGKEVLQLPQRASESLTLAEQLGHLRLRVAGSCGGWKRVKIERASLSKAFLLWGGRSSIACSRMNALEHVA